MAIPRKMTLHVSQAMRFKLAEMLLSSDVYPSLGELVRKAILFKHFVDKQALAGKEIWVVDPINKDAKRLVMEFMEPAPREPLTLTL